LKSQFLLLRKIGRRYHQVIKLAMKGFPVNAWLAFIRMLANQAILVMDKGIMEKNLWYSAQRKNYQ